MRRILIQPGTRLKLDGVTLRLRDRFFAADGAEIWEVYNEATRLHETLPRLDIDRRLFNGERIGASERHDDQVHANSSSALPQRTSIGVRFLSDGEDLGDDTEAMRSKRFRFERAFVREVNRRKFHGWTNSKIVVDGRVTDEFARDRIISEAAAVAGTEVFGKPRKSTLASYYRYSDKHADGPTYDVVVSGQSTQGRRDQLGPGVGRMIRDEMERFLRVWEAEASSKSGLKKLYTFKDVVNAVGEFLERENAKRPYEKIALPSEVTLRIYWNGIPAYRRACVMQGLVKARAAHRRPGIPDVAEYPLHVTQYDETQIPFYVIHDLYGVLLGKPTLSWVVDLYSGGLCGFYLGFDYASDLATTQAMRHAMLPKPYVRDLYPNVKDPWLHGGLMKAILFDNSLTARSKTIASICDEVDVEFDFQPVRMPWIKGQVETTFAQISKMLLEGLPGFTPPPEWKVSAADYDPRQHAVIGLHRLLAIIHAWICDEYHTRRPDTGKERSPNYLWEEGTRRVQPSFLDSGTDLDALFGIVAKGNRIDQRGFVFEDIWYYSEEVNDERSLMGAVRHLPIKVNPLNLEKAYFRGSTGRWYPAVARPNTSRGNTTMRGMNLHLWRLLGKQANRMYGNTSIESRYSAGRAVRELVAQSFNEGISVANAQRVARAEGISSASLFSLLDTNGRLPLLQPQPQAAAVAPPDRPPRSTLNKKADQREPDTRLVIPDLDFDDSLEPKNE